MILRVLTVTEIQDIGIRDIPIVFIMEHSLEFASTLVKSWKKSYMLMILLGSLIDMDYVPNFETAIVT